MPFVLFLLGWPQNTEDALLARAALVPYLHHHQPRIRWAAALSLGWLRDERAIPALSRMLTDQLPEGGAAEYEERDGLAYDECLDQWRCGALIRVILNLRTPVFASSLQSALARMLELEHAWAARFGAPLLHDEARREWPDLNSPGIEAWARYQDMLVFALGRIGAFDALASVGCPVGLVGVQAWQYKYTRGSLGKQTDQALQHLPFRALLWRVHGVFGWLLDELPRFPRSTQGGIPLFAQYQGLSETVKSLLAERYHLSPEDQLEALSYYEWSLYLVNTMDMSHDLLRYMALRNIPVVL